MATSALECLTCHRMLAPEEFSMGSKNVSRGNRMPHCRVCRSNSRASSNYVPRRFPDWARAEVGKRKKYLADMKRYYPEKYGISYDDALQMYGRGCAVCGKEHSDHESLVIDHDHSTGAVRNALCNRCNVVLGLCEDKPELLKDLAHYLDVH